MKCTELSKCTDVFAASDVQRYLWACEGLARCLQKHSLGNLAKPSLKDISQRCLSGEISFLTETHPDWWHSGVRFCNDSGDTFTTSLRSVALTH